MATISFRTYKAELGFRGSVVLDMGLGSEPPFPEKVIEASSMAEIEAAFDTYKAEALASGKPMAVSMMLKTGRAPNGFKKAKAAVSFVTVNL